MRQININVTPEFERDLKLYMQRTGVKQKSEAIRRAVHKAAEQESAGREAAIDRLYGLALKYPPRKKRKFLTEDDLWS